MRTYTRAEARVLLVIFRSALIDFVILPPNPSFEESNQQKGVRRVGAELPLSLVPFHHHHHQH